MAKEKTIALKNATKDWKTTVMGVIGGIIMLSGILWPEKIDTVTGQEIATAIDEIITGIGVAIPLIIAIFGKD